MKSQATTAVTFPSRIGAATDNESSRFALGAVKIDGNAERVWASATDGRIAASVLCEGHTDESRLVPAELVPRTKKAMRDGSAQVERNGQWENQAGKIVEQDVEGRFPRVDECYPAVDGDDVICLNIDAQLLLNLANALGIDDCDHGVTLFIRPPKEGELVDMGIAVLGPKGFGLLMPLHSDRFGPPQAPRKDQYEAKRRDFIAATRGE